MKQIQNYLSKIHNIESVLLVGEPKELKGLKDWLQTVKKVKTFYEVRDTSQLAELRNGQALDNHEPESHKPDNHEPESYKPESHEPESHEPESYEPESHEPESHEPESHKPESHEPESHKPESHKPESHESESHKPENPVSGGFCFSQDGNTMQSDQTKQSLAIHFDAIIFENADLTLLKEMAGSFAIHYLIGKVGPNEDYFSIWESFRTSAKHIYISRDKGLAKEEITNDVAPFEILEWEAKSEVELSIILPVYNVSACLPKCLETLTKWDAPYVEFLFVNDGSTDSSPEIIAEFAQKDARVKLINKPNGGCASARNKGIEEAKGERIGFVDSDDFVDETMFYKLFKRALMGDYDYTYCGYQEYYEDTSESAPVKNDCMSSLYTRGTYRQDHVQLLVVNTRVAIWRCLYKKEILNKNNIRFHEDLPRFDDLPFRVEYIWCCQSAVCVPEFLYYYRLGRKGQDVSCTDERLYVHFPIFEYLDEFVDAFKDKRLEDLLQIVKINTHGFALTKLEKKYKRNYLIMAKKQLKRNMGYVRTLFLMLMYTGKRHFGWYTWLMMRFWL